MSKKMLKSSLILGALMAFVITGNVMAAEQKFDGNVNVTGNVQAATFNGINIVTNDQGSFAIGKDATVTGYYYGSTNIANNNNSIAIGTNAKAVGYNGVGGDGLDSSFYSGAIAIGCGAVANNASSMAIGGAANADGQNTLAVGRKANSKNFSVAVGGNTTADNYSVAIGSGAMASGEYSVAIGHSSTATEKNVVSVGSDAATGGDSIKRRIVNVADGIKANDAVTVGQMKEALTNKADKSDTLLGYGIADAYTKTEVDTELVKKANAADVYVKSEVYTKTETDTVLEEKADKATTLDGYGITDAYTKAEVDSMIGGSSAALDGINQRLDRTNAKINKVGAGAAALAALHPLDYDPDDKLTFSAGVGNYAGENAAALGAFYRPNEKFMVSLGGTMGNGENMVNLGLSIGLDKANGLAKMSKRELIQEVNAVKAENEAIKADNEAMKAEMAEMKAMLQELLNKK